VGEEGEGVYDQSAGSWEQLDQEPAGGSSHRQEFGMVGTWRRSRFSAMDRTERVGDGAFPIRGHGILPLLDNVTARTA